MEPFPKVNPFASNDSKIIGTQFHPEVIHTPDGKQMLKNFAYEICNCKGEWEMSKFIEQTVSYVSELVSDDHVILGLSGGVD